MTKSELQVGRPCVVLFEEDDCYYRAIIKKTETESGDALVYFVDYGNIVKENPLHIKEIKDDFLSLPAQAIECQLFCPNKNDWSESESNQFADEINEKDLEAEFVEERDGKYQVLLKEFRSGIQGMYVNELFAKGMDLIRAKEEIRKKAAGLVKIEVPCPIRRDFASFNQKWLSSSFQEGAQEKIQVSWFNDPENFFCKLANEEKDFRKMMNDIQSAYVDCSPISETPKVRIGSKIK